MPMPSDVPMAIRTGTRSTYTSTAMMNAIPPIPTMPPKKPSTTARPMARRRSYWILSAPACCGSTGRSSITAPANARIAKISSSARSGVACDTSAPMSDATAAGGPIVHTRSIDTFP